VCGNITRKAFNRHCKKKKGTAVLGKSCVQKFPDWPPGARTANGTALRH